MKISKFIPKGAIALNMNPASKQEAIDILLDLLDSAGVIKNKAAVRRDILAREAAGSTGLNSGVATPHAQSPFVKKPAISVITVPAGVDFDAPDSTPARLLLLFATPDKADAKALVEMGRLAVLLMDPDFRDALLAAKTVEEFLTVVDSKEQERSAKSLKEKPVEHVKIIAVTACPTGISSAHMAAEALKRSALTRGLNIHVETRGASGVYDELSAEDISNADAVIVAASAPVPLHRFNGKHLLQTACLSAVNKPDQLIERVLTGNTPIHQQQADDATLGGRILRTLKSIFS